MGTVHDRRGAQDFRDAALVAVHKPERSTYAGSGLVAGRSKRRISHTINSTKTPRKIRRRKEDHYQPTRSTHRGHISADSGCGIALNPSSEYRHVPADIRILPQSKVAAKGGEVPSDLSLIFNHYASAKRSYISRDMAADPDAAAEACCFTDLFVSPNVDISSDLSAIVVSIGECRACECNPKHKTDKQPL